MKAFEKAPQETYDLLARVIATYHPELADIGATFDLLYCTDDAGEALMHAGYPAYAVIKATNLKDRVCGRADAEICIDASEYIDMTEAQQIALLDHELTHLKPKRNTEGILVTDDIGRPTFSMRKHDYQFGWFRDVAIRHGDNSVECTQANKIMKRDGAAFFTERE